MACLSAAFLFAVEASHVARNAALYVRRPRKTVRERRRPEPWHILGTAAWERVARNAVAVQTKDFGFSFQATWNSAIACCSSGTLSNEPRRMRLLVNSPNQCSTRFGQREFVGTY